MQPHSAVPPGLMQCRTDPGVETPGYSRLSLRDRTQFQNTKPFRILATRLTTANCDCKIPQSLSPLKPYRKLFHHFIMVIKTMKSRVGKIARMPKEIRDELNRRI